MPVCKISILVLFLLSVQLQSRAQDGYKRISAKFFLFYNAEQPDSIFSLYAPTLKEKLPLEKTRAVISGLHVQFGDLQSLMLIKTDSGFNQYKAVFKDQTLILLLALDTENWIEGYRLVPYKPEKDPAEKQ
jgi:uncharacterized protein